MVFNSGVSTADALAELEAMGDYEYYTQTGNCPLLLDMDMFLNGFFTDVFLNDSPLVNPVSLSNKPFEGNYLSVDLLKTLAAPTIITLPLSSLTITTSATPTVLTLKFTVGSTNTGTTTITVIDPTYNWNNYKTLWKIKRIKQFFYDRLGSTPASRIFKFSCIAMVQENGTGPLKEVLLTGQTCAAIGECSTSNNGIGQVLDPNSGNTDDGNSCDKKFKFKAALVAFLNQLKNERDSKQYYQCGIGYLPNL